MLELGLDGQGSLQAQLQRALKQLLLAGHLAQGARLPGSRALAARLKLSRNTVIAAYAQLEAEGYVRAVGGSGFLVQGCAGQSANAPVLPGSARPRLAPLAERAVQLASHRPPPRYLQPPPRYDLCYGRPLPQAALFRSWRLALNAAVETVDPDYPAVAGLPALRRALAGYLGRRRGFSVDPARILITCGAQQALDLCVRTLAGPAMPAILEDPHYQGTRQALVAAGVEVQTLAVDADGLDPAGLPASPALLFLTPAHQFPRGCVLSLPRRLALLNWAATHQGWVIEDDYDGEFRFDAQPLAALKALDQSDRVIYVGTFSKALFPALRLGFLVLPEALMQAFEAVKWLTDRGCPSIEQQALASLMDSGRFERLLRQAGRALDERRRALLAALQQHCGSAVQVEGAAAGMHLTVWLPDWESAQLPELLKRAHQSGLGLYPITPYFVRPPATAGLLLGYAALAPRDFDEAARRLAQLLSSHAPSQASHPLPQTTE